MGGSSSPKYLDLALWQPVKHPGCASPCLVPGNPASCPLPSPLFPPPNHHQNGNGRVPWANGKGCLLTTTTNPHSPGTYLILIRPRSLCPLINNTRALHTVDDVVHAPTASLDKAACCLAASDNLIPARFAATHLHLHLDPILPNHRPTRRALSTR
ncbi:hypothetical protein N431DRAFT_432795 [Stipitochalara longipes BDJ]|nr:hypothetical protein N431DRAFT_432795 [Stipitochalara longipes BDJ]